MRKHLLATAALLALFSPAAQAANTTVTAMSAASALGGTELFYVVQGGADRKATPAQIDTYVRSLMGTGVSAALNIATGAAGSVILFNGALGTPSSGTATNLTGLPVTTGISGLGTNVAAFLATPSSANLRAALTDETGTGIAYFVGGALGTPASGVATNITGLPISTGLTGTGTGVLTALAANLNAATGLVGALTPTSNNCVVGNGSAWTSTTCPGGGSGVSSIAGNTGAFTLNATSGITNSTNDIVCTAGSSSQFGCLKVDNTTITAAAGVITSVVAATPSVQSGTNYPIVAADRGKIIYLSNASAQTPTLPVASTPGNGWFVTACNIGAGIQTVTPVTSTIGGAATLAIPAGSASRPVCWNIVSDGTNYVLVPTGNNNTIASGTSALGTSAIASAACATAVTTSAAGVVTTDVVLASFNGDPTAVTGYVPLTAGMLTIVGYPTANNVNFKVCNNTTSSITPGAITLNWRVTR